MISPKDARTGKQLSSMSVVKCVKDSYTIMVNTNVVTITGNAESRDIFACITMAKRDFDKLISWYQTPQKVKP